MSIKLMLGGKLNNWEKFKARKRNKTFVEIRHKIIARDKEKCVFCNYHGRTLEVINLDNNYANNVPRNLATACVFCARCTLLDYYKLDYAGADRIIYLPEFSQPEVNTLCRALFIEASMGDTGSEGAYNAKSILAQLLDRATLLDQKAESKLSHPGLFLFYMNSESANPELIKRLRWLPDPSDYADAIKLWKAEQ